VPLIHGTLGTLDAVVGGLMPRQSPLWEVHRRSPVRWRDARAEAYPQHTPLLLGSGNMTAFAASHDRRARLRCDNSRMLGFRDLVATLHALGIVSGDTIMVHASLRAIGPVEDGAAGLVRALDAAVGGDGTILMTIGARDDFAWVNERPEAERAGLLAGTEPFDCSMTPADPDVGVLAEVFRQTAGSLISNHPEGRFAARGRLAEHVLVNVPWDDYYGPGSPLERFVDARGKILRLGAHPNTVTLLHYAEYLADVPHKRRVRRHRLVAGVDGAQIRVIECLDDAHGIVDYPGEDYFATILEGYLRERASAVKRVGSARSELLDAADLVAFAAGWMTDHLAMRPPRENSTR
jgi:aminoglycoside N3'-acetyltransferase